MHHTILKLKGIASKHGCDALFEEHNKGILSVNTLPHRLHLPLIDYIKSHFKYIYNDNHYIEFKAIKS